MTSPLANLISHLPVRAFGPALVVLGEKSGKYPDGNQVLVQGADTRLAFDTPLVANRIGPAFDEVDAVVLGHVHEDHMAGLHRVPRASVQVHQADLAAAQSWPGLARHFGYDPETSAEVRRRFEAEFFYTPRPDATPYQDGAQWDLGGGVRVRAHHLPGHTGGHCVLVVEPEGLAFIGDFDLSSFGPYYGDACSHLGDFRRSLRRLAELDARVWVTSHHRAVVTDRAAFLQQLAEFAHRIDERTERLLQMLSRGPQTVAELAAQRLLYPPEADAPWVDAAERRSIQQHLDELLADGQVLATGDGHYALRRG